MLLFNVLKGGKSNKELLKYQNLNLRFKNVLFNYRDNINNYITDM